MKTVDDYHHNINKASPNWEDFNERGEWLGACFQHRFERFDAPCVCRGNKWIHTGSGVYRKVYKADEVGDKA